MYDKFINGRRIFCFDFIAEDMPEVIPSDLSGQLKNRIEFQSEYVISFTCITYCRYYRYNNY